MFSLSAYRARAIASAERRTAVPPPCEPRPAFFLVTRWWPFLRQPRLLSLFTQAPRRGVLRSAGGRAIVQYSARASEKIEVRWTRRSKHSGGSPSASTPPHARPHPEGSYLRDGPTSRRCSSPLPRERTLFACSRPTTGRQPTCSRLARSKGAHTPSLQRNSTLAKILSK